MAEGMPVEEVRSMCDLHSQVTRDVVVQLAPPPSVEPGHPSIPYGAKTTHSKR